MAKFKYSVRIRAGDLPKGLRIQQRGVRNLDHYEIMPNEATTTEEYEAQLNSVPIAVEASGDSSGTGDGEGEGGGEGGGGGGVPNPPREEGGVV